MILAYFIFSLILLGSLFVVRRKHYTNFATSLFLLMQLGLTVYMILHRGEVELGFFRFDEIAILFSSLLCLLGITSFYHALISLKDEKVWDNTIYQAGFIGLMASIIGVYISNNITVNWIFMEATTLSVATLIYHNRTVRALEATWKYIFICSTGIALAYLGILFVSLTIKGTPASDMSYGTLTALWKSANPIYLRLAFLFVLVGYSAKMEVFPLYTISVDANYVAPAPASGFISSALVNAGFVSIFRVYKALIDTPIGIWIQYLLITTGLISLLIAAIYMQRVRNYKRLFAYSTVENMGVVLIGLGVGGIGIFAAILQVLLHALVKSSLFYQLGQAHQILKSYRITRAGEYFQLYPAGAMVLLIGTIAIAAIPPSGLFISEIMIFKSTVNTGHWGVFIATALLLCFVIYGIFSKVLPMLFSPLDEKPGELCIPKAGQTISQYLFLGIVIVLCFYQPAFLTDLIGKAAGIMP